MERQYQSLIDEYLGYFPCVALIGARQTGKSTLLQMLGDERPIYDLEQRADYEQIATDPDQFLRINNHPIAIDEAQILPEIFQALRVAIDRDRQAYGKYVITGSSSPELLQAISESLAGRVAVIELSPLSFSETQQITNPNVCKVFSTDASVEALSTLKPSSDSEQALQAIQRFWFEGGYPEPWIRSNNNSDERFTSVWREQYIKTYIERDVARLYPKLNAVRYRRFIELLAASSGSIINYSNFASILDVTQPTIKDYIRIAHGTFIWRTLPAYTKNVSKRVVKHAKGYLRDSGLLHHILQIPNMRRLTSHPQMGASWESVVIEEILRSLNAAGIHYSPYFYRTSGGAEIDLVLEGEFGVIPVEIKHTQHVKARQLRAINDFVNEFEAPYGVVVNNDERIRCYSENVVGIPFTFLAVA